jgi:hypothetical protein
MNERTAGAALLVIGVVALFAAIVGGGIKIREIEVGSVPSRLRQGLLAAFGIVVGTIGLALVIPDDAPVNTADTENVANVDENAATDNGPNTEENAGSNGSEENSGDNSADTTTQAQ